MTKFTRRLEALKRRRDFLEQRIAEYTGNNNSRDVQEWSALKWAIAIVEAHPELQQGQPKASDKVSDNELIKMGMNLGVYLFAKLFAEEAVPSQKSWEILRDHTASAIEAQTGIPAEDLALTLQPTVDEMVARMQR